MVGGPSKGPERLPQPIVVLFSAAWVSYQSTTSEAAEKLNDAWVSATGQHFSRAAMPAQRTWASAPAETSSLHPSHGKSTITTPENLKLLLPPRQSRGVSRFE